MPEIRGGYDVLFDKIKSKLEAYATAQKAINASYDFEVKPDYNRVLPANSAGAYVVLTLDNLSPISSRSAKGVHYSYDVTYSMDLIVYGGGVQATNYSRGDELAGVRLRYLVEQVLNALSPSQGYDYGLPKGSIARTSMPRVTFFRPEMQQGERPIAGAQVQLDFSLAWNPSLMSETDLESISVDAGQISALFEYTED